jgi:Alcohol dehydrogenase GroES-like domain
MNTMRAVRAHRRGAPGNWCARWRRAPSRHRVRVLVAVHAASITSDELTLDATWTGNLDPGGRDRTPIIPSHEMSGVVAALGPGVTEAEAGDEVYGLIPFVRDGAAAGSARAASAVWVREPRAAWRSMSSPASSKARSRLICAVRITAISWRATSRIRSASRSPSARGAASRSASNRSAASTARCTSMASDFPFPRRWARLGCSH